MNGKVVVHHALAVPAPAQGHLMPLMRLCSILAAQHGFRITVVNIDAIHKRIAAADAQQVNQHPATSDDAEEGPYCIGHNMWQLRLVDADVDIDLSTGFDISLMHLMDVVNRCIPPALERLICKLNASSVDSPPVTCLISDVVMTAGTQEVADKFGLPRVALYPSCQTFNLWSHYLINGDLSTNQVLEVIGNRSAMEKKQLDEIFHKQMEGLPIIRNRDLPHLQHISRDETPEFLQDMLPKTAEAYTKAHAMLVNSVEELESEAFAVLRRRLIGRSNVHVLPVGPLLDVDMDATKSASSSASLWKEDETSLEWLDQQPPGSVLYIAFGSITCLSPSQLEEFVAGLVASKQRFLWVFRPDLVDSSSTCNNYITVEYILSKAREEGIEGYVVSWAPQLRVLSHPAVAAFLTHCGWNSTMEALASGVPMLCWPYFADQLLNARLIVEDWKVGLTFDEQESQDTPNGRRRYLVSRNEVHKQILAIMQDDLQGKKLQQNAARLKETLAICRTPNGKSNQNIRFLVETLSK